MKDVILKVVNKHIIVKGDEITVNQVSLASELSEMMTAFVEWEHSRETLISDFTFKTKKFTLRGKKKHYSVNDLFLYWYENIYIKKL
jgi:hypothetical protein